MGRKKAPISDMNVMEKQEAPLAKNLRALITDPNALREYLGCSTQAINQYRLGTSRPTLENLCKIADFYGVSTDFLLGRVPYKTKDTEKRDVCEYTGLSEAAVDRLHTMAGSVGGFNFISGLLTSRYMEKIISDMSRLHNALLLSEIERMGGGLEALYKTIDPDTDLTAVDYCAFLQYRLSQNLGFAVTDSVGPSDEEVFEKIATLDEEDRNFLYAQEQKRREKLEVIAKVGGFKIRHSVELPKGANALGEYKKRD